MPGASPYVSVGMLTSQPAGLAWNVVPTLTASAPEQLAQLSVVCNTASSQADTYVRQPLRATVNTETGTGPNRPRVSVDPVTGTAGLITRRWPVTQVLAVLVSPASSFPPSWTPVTPGQWRIRNPAVFSSGPAPVTIPSGGNAVDVAPGWITRDLGPGGWNVQHSYVSAYPHAGIASEATPVGSGTQTILVDDVTGWAGVGGFIFDGTFTEFAQCTTASATTPVSLPNGAGTAQAGPGTLTLSAPLAYAHAPGTVISALPLSGLHAVALMAAVQALETIDAIATQSMSGQMAGGTGALAEQAELWLDEFRRVA